MSSYTRNSISDFKLLGVLLTPSWLSAGLVLLSSLSICLGTIVLARYQASSVRLSFLHYQAGGLDQTYRRYTDQLFGANTFLGNLPLLVFWGLVGIIVYLFAINVFTALRNVTELKSKLNYVHADQRQILWHPLEQLLVHLGVLVLWAGYIHFFFQQVLPYCVAASIIGSGTYSVLQNGLYGLLAVLTLSVALHIHVVLLRLLLLRPRLFSSTLYIDIHQPL